MINIEFEAYRGAGAQNVTAKSIGVWISTRGHIYFTFIFSFLRSSVEAKRGVEFRHSTRNASRTWLKAGNGVS